MNFHYLYSIKRNNEPYWNMKLNLHNFILKIYFQVHIIVISKTNKQEKGDATKTNVSKKECFKRNFLIEYISLKLLDTFIFIFVVSWKTKT